MDFFVVVLIVMMIVGAIFVLHGALSRNPDDEETVTYGDGFSHLEKRLTNLETTMTEADEAAVVLDDMTKNAFKEFDEKYQTLLFLYNMIDDKQKNMAQKEISAAVAPVQQLCPAADPLAELVTRRKGASINPKYDIVLQMQAEGKTHDEIAKELNMGKGQVALILNLGGATDD